MRRGLLVVLALVALVVAACSSGGGGSDSEDAAADGEAAAIDNQEDYEEYLQQAADVPLAESDGAIPPDLDPTAGGAPGFSRYVFRDSDTGVLPSLVEGPLGQQVRCQDPDLPCSYLELKELAESGDDIPDGLDMDADELDQLVEELDTLHGVAEQYEDVDDACADGFFSDRTQTPNMGSHFTKMAHVLDGEVDPAKPDILLYARADGADPDGPLGQCGADGWEGQPVEFVGTSFIVLNGQVGDDHPEGFAGQLDNWHIHYNLCRGLGRDVIVDRETCEAQGGGYSETLGWMIHAWVDPEHDNQLGVFSMWNPSIWPVQDPDQVVADREVAPADADAFLPIANFSFGTIEAEVGDEVVVGNSDSVPHTVTAGTVDDPDDAFDSGVFAPGESFRTSFDEPGSYSFYCTLHPDMTGTIVVE